MRESYAAEPAGVHKDHPRPNVGAPHLESGGAGKVLH
jgi:hypothetical protein